MRRNRWIRVAQFCAAGLMLTACSAAAEGGQSGTMAEPSSSQEQTAQSTAEQMTQGETTSAEETTVPEDSTTLTVYSAVSDTNGMQTGWYADVLMEELNMRIKVLNASDAEPYGEDQQKLMDTLNQADIIIWHSLTPEVYEWARSGRLLQWDDALLDTYGQTIREQLSDELEFSAGLMDGAVYWLIGDAGMKEIYGDEVDLTQGRHPIFMINASSEQPEEAMRYLNWLASSEGAVTRWNGPKGLCWDVDENGYYYRTDLGLKCADDFETEMPDGTSYREGMSFMQESIWYYAAQIYDSGHGQNYHLESVPEETVSDVSDEK